MDTDISNQREASLKKQYTKQQDLEVKITETSSTNIIKEKDQHNQTKSQNLENPTLQKEKLLSNTQENSFLEINYPDEIISTHYLNPQIQNFLSSQSFFEKNLMVIQNIQQVENYIKIMQKGLPGNFANSLYKNTHKKIQRKAQYLLYEKKYAIGKYERQLPICIVSAGKNMLRKKKYQQFLDSLERQNYTNYRVVITDDKSDDGNHTFITKVKDQDNFDKNRQNIGALANKDMMIRNHCSEGSIVFDIDADDSLIGAQVFKLVNALYQKTGKWFIYFNYIFQKTNEKNHKIGKGATIPSDVFEKSLYRTSQRLWITTQLRTYLRDLYVKIPPYMLFEDLSNYRYYLWASDRFVMYALAELAGQNYTEYIPQIVYYYNVNGQREKCFMTQIFLDQSKCRMQTPLLPLSSLTQKVQQKQDYKVPDNTKKKRKGL